MSLHNVMHRRKFLERSALGVGGVLCSSVLLQSCTDHNIPGPNSPVINPPLTGSEGINWNNDAKLVVTAALRQIPEVGGFMSTMITLIWPSSGNGPWDQVRAQVEELVDKKLNNDDYNRVMANLAGLRNVINDYNDALNSPTVDYQRILTEWRDVYTTFDLYQPNFQQKDDEVLLLPIFAQFANLYLGLLRDAVAYGHAWGMTQGEIQTYAGKCADKITEFTTYTTKWYTTGRAIKQDKPRDDQSLEPFRSTNAYDRDMIMMVLDYMDTWPYYDITKYPNGAINEDNTPIHLFTREIYSDPYGNRINVDRITPDFALPLSQATQFPTHITVWGGQRIDAVQLTYPAGGGPNGVTTTPRMGDQNGGSIQGSFDISSDQYISSVLISYDYVVSGPGATMAIDTLQFLFGNDNGGSLSNQMGAKPGQFKSGNIGFDYYALSSIYIDGVNETEGNSANCIVFGFKRWPL